MESVLSGRPSPDLKITKHTPGYWQATFDYPPLNLFNNNTFLALLHLVEQLEVDKDVKVIVFDSANPDYCPTDKISSTSGQISWCDLPASQF
jgi:enoyl-CoA hydratase/carnithine racemase